MLTNREIDLKMKKRSFFLAIIVFLILMVSVSAYKVDPNIEEELEDKEEVSVVVVLKDEPDFAIKANELEGSGKETKIPSRLERKKLMIKSQQDKVLSKLNLKNEKTKTLLTQETDNINLTQETDKVEFKLAHKYSTINGFSGEITKQGLEKLKENPDVAKIHLDEVMYGFLDESVPQIGGNDVWRLQLNNTNITGKGETICILDSGIDTDHSAFSGRILDQYCYCSSCPDGTTEDDSAEDDQGHGTHVTGIAAGNHSIYKGVAPDAGIIAIKVLNSDDPPRGSTSNIIAGLDWCINNASKYNISVISMSLGGGGPHNEYCDSVCPFTSSINSAVGENISVVVAAGNSGWTNGISQPACVENATPVGAYLNTNRGAILYLFAPGNWIRAPCMGGSVCQKSGTSMSTPHVSGSIALLHQFTKLWNNTRRTPQQAEDILYETGIQVYESENDKYNSNINIFYTIVSLDNFAPNVTFVNPTPQNKSTTNATIFINVTVNDTLNVDSCVFEWNYTNQSMNHSGSGKFVICYINKSINNNGTYYYRVYANDSNNNIDFTELRYVNATNITNTAPEAQNVAITSTDSLNRTNGSLSGSWDFYDFNEDPYVDNETKWYNNSIEVTSLANLTEISSGNTTKNQNWTFSVRVFDGGKWGTWVNSTNLTIADAAPLLNTPIPNQTWYMNTNLTLNLSEYFIDIDGDNLTFDVVNISCTNSSPSVNITAVINGSNVTLIPDTNWADPNTIKFNATDGSSVALSNTINLTVTADLDGDGFNATIYGGTDCNDNNANVHPEATEVCGNNVDDDCDGSVDEGCNRGTSSSGGRGGRAAISVTTTSQTINTGTVAAGGTASAKFTASDLGVTDIAITIKQTVTASSVTVVNQGANKGIAISALTVSDVSANIAVYSYLKITVDKISNANIEKAVIKFKIPKKEGYDPTTVELKRYDSTKKVWSSLSTRWIFQDPDNYYFEAETTSFSIFAIVGKKLVIEKVEEAAVNISKSEEENATIEHKEDIEFYEPTTKEKRFSLNKLMWIISGLFGISIIILIILSAKKKKTSLKKLEKHTKVLISEGYPEEHIEYILKKLGWKEHYIKHIMKKINKELKKLEEYIETSLAKGHKEETIKWVLIKSGWPKHHIHHAFKKRKK